MKFWIIWFIHGLKILAGGLGAYLLVALPVALIGGAPKMTSSNTVLNTVCLIIGVFLIPICIAGFGYLFTKLYTNTTWGHDAVKDMSKRDGRPMPKKS